MMRTVEAFIVIVIILGAFGITSYYTALPNPKQVAPINLRRLALTTLETLDSTHDLSMAAFGNSTSARWSNLQVALAASLPANVIYNLTVYDVNSQATGTQLYSPIGLSTSNAASLGVASDASTYTVASSNLTFSVTPEKIGNHGDGGTLYILNCSDAYGWWITGYTVQSLAGEFYNMLNSYFKVTVMVNNTSQLRDLLDGKTLSTNPDEKVQNATIINTFGESVPMPYEYSQGQSRESQGYDASGGVYAYSRYCYTLGNLTRAYNWTWTSIVGYPFYYVSNTNQSAFANIQNGWGIYGMNMTSQGGLRSFLQGLDKQMPYHYDNSGAINSQIGTVTFTQTILNNCSKYGIYPSPNQTATRALSILPGYNLTAKLDVFSPVNVAGVIYRPGTLYTHIFTGVSDVTGSFLALGVTRIPDIRIAAISLLSCYNPNLNPSSVPTNGTSRIVILQLGLAGGS